MQLVFGNSRGLNVPAYDEKYTTGRLDLWIITYRVGETYAQTPSYSEQKTQVSQENMTCDKTKKYINFCYRIFRDICL